MAYLRNSTVNLLNLHYGLHMLVLNGAGVFWLVFLLKSGVPVPIIFAALALVVAGRFVLRPSILFLGPRLGLRALVILGTLLSAVQYPILAEVHGVGPMLLALCLSASVGDTFYWTTYHAYFAALGDAEHRGHQIGAREALAAMAAIVGPLAGGWALLLFGPRVAFGAAAGAMIFAALPILYTPPIVVARQAPGVLRMAIPSILLFAADGWISAGVIFVWQIALFLSLGESFTAFGGALALAGIVGAAGGLLLGRHIDAGHGSRAVWVALLGMGALAVFRALSTHDATLAVLANALGALAGCLYIPTLMTSVYNQAKRSPCTLRFHIAAEGGWDVGCASACLLAAAFSALDLPLSYGILLALPGVALSLAVLRNYYARGIAAMPTPLALPATEEV